MVRVPRPAPSLPVGFGAAAAVVAGAAPFGRANDHTKLEPSTPTLPGASFARAISMIVVPVAASPKLLTLVSGPLYAVTSRVRESASPMAVDLSSSRTFPAPAGASAYDGIAESAITTRSQPAGAQPGVVAGARSKRTSFTSALSCFSVAAGAGAGAGAAAG